MVAFDKSVDLPANINTVESLVAWGTMVLTNLHFQQEIQEAPGVVEKVSVAQQFPISLNGAYEWRYVGRCSLKLNPEYQHTGKLWAHIVPLSNASIPAAFKTA